LQAGFGWLLASWMDGWDGMGWDGWIGRLIGRLID